MTRRYSAAATRATDPDEAFWKLVLDFLRPAEGRLARAFQRAVREARAGILADDIALLIRAGDLDAAVTLMLGPGVANQSLFIGLRIAVAEAALNTATAMSAGTLKVGLGTMPGSVLLDTLSPHVVSAIRTATMASVQDVTNTTRAALRTTLHDTMVAGLHPYESVHRMTGVLGLTDRDAIAVRNYRRELETGSGASVNRALRDKRLSVGRELSADEVERRVAGYADRLLRHRAETISITEAARAFNIGQHIAWTEAARHGRVEPQYIRRKWLIAPDERTCPVCRAIVDLNADGVGVNEPFQTPDGPYLMPPKHPRCRCVVILDVKLTDLVYDMERARNG